MDSEQQEQSISKEKADEIFDSHFEKFLQKFDEQTMDSKHSKQDEQSICKVVDAKFDSNYEEVLKKLDEKTMDSEQSIKEEQSICKEKVDEKFDSNCKEILENFDEQTKILHDNDTSLEPRIHELEKKVEHHLERGHHLLLNHLIEMRCDFRRLETSVEGLQMKIFDIENESNTPVKLKSSEAEKIKDKFLQTEASQQNSQCERLEKVIKDLEFKVSSQRGSHRGK